ncbi:hypothetical protein NQZ68_020151 [Dissostichus eleginoides]|nr:hypothetical protein NQZ68_020151 [Dissostichus eleginoides]
MEEGRMEEGRKDGGRTDGGRTDGGRKDGGRKEGWRKDGVMEDEGGSIEGACGRLMSRGNVISDSTNYFPRFISTPLIQLAWRKRRMEGFERGGKLGEM